MKRSAGLSVRRGWIAACCLLLVVSADECTAVGAGVARTHPAPDASTHSETLSERLRLRLEAAAADGELEAGGERIHALVTLQSLYESRVFRPLWVGSGSPTGLADSLCAYLRGVTRDGLRPSDYHLGAVDRELSRVRAKAGARTSSAGRLVDLELLLTDAYLMCASHSLAGRLNPETIDPEWFAVRRGADFAKLVEEAVSSGMIRESLESLLPHQPGYTALRSALAGYRAAALAGGWPTVSTGPTLKPGESGPRVAELRARLEASGDLEHGSGGDEFDHELEAAVRRFQECHGLDVDGAVGRSTLAALNIGPGERARQMVVNLERWRWLPESMGAVHVVVNVASFSLTAVEGDSTALEMRAIVGRSYRRTPVFSDRITYMVLNPRWEVPDNIAVSDVLREVRADSTYLSRMGMRVLRGWGSDETEIDPATVDWSRVPVRPFPYRFRQDPGPANALGRVKFMFPNSFNVYLHDTPARGLFAKSERAFSSGCIRVQKPLELAEWLMREDPRWSRGSIESAVATGTEQTVRLPRPIPIHVLYWTAWVDGEGNVHFRNDVYGRDALVTAALDEPPPEAEDDAND